MSDRYPHQRWAEAQVAALLEIGYNAADAQRCVDWVLRHLPAGADPAAWVPPDYLLAADDADPVQDARVAWYASPDVPAAYKRLLDATPEARRR